MSSSECIKIANEIRMALEQKKPFTVPKMRVGDFGLVLGYLSQGK